METEMASNESRIPGDRVLYHYTTLGSAEKIIRSCELWATNIYYLNDVSEFGHGVDLMRSIWREVSSMDHRSKDFLDAIEWPTRRPDLNVFVVSFSEIGDLLSQWRSYCSANRGISLGFLASDLQKQGTLHGFNLVQCNYDVNHQRAVIATLVKEWTATYADALINGDPADVIQRFAKEFAHVAASFKHGSFAEEREWRLVAVSDHENPEIRYREGLSTLIPYLTFRLPIDEKQRLLMRHAIVGPTPHPDLTYVSVRQMAKNFKVRYGQISFSNSPVRAW